MVRAGLESRQHRVAADRARQPPIPNGASFDDYDWDCIFASARLIRKDETLIFYGSNDGWFMGWRNGYFNLAHLRPDGFAGCEQFAGGSNKTCAVTTVPVTVIADSICVNADVAPSGYVKVVLTEEGNTDIAESELVTTAVTDAQVQWKKRFSLAGLQGQKIRLKFELRDAKLYSFSFQ